MVESELGTGTEVGLVFDDEHLVGEERGAHEVEVGVCRGLVGGRLDVKTRPYRGGYRLYGCSPLCYYSIMHGRVCHLVMARTW